MWWKTLLGVAARLLLRAHSTTLTCTLELRRPARQRD